MGSLTVAEHDKPEAEGRARRQPIDPAERRDHALIARGRRVWKEAVEEAASDLRMNASTLVDVALVHYLKSVNYPKELPKR